MHPPYFCAWIPNAAEIRWSVHDPPAVWKRWPGIGGLPALEVMPCAPVEPYPYPLPDDGLPTLHVKKGQT